MRNVNCTTAIALTGCIVYELRIRLLYSCWFTRLIMYVYYIIHTVYFSNGSPMQIFRYQF